MRCLACGGDNPPGNRFCSFCGNPLAPAAPLPTSRVTGGRPIHLERNGPVTAIKGFAVFVLCAVISRVAWGPLSLPSRIINAILPLERYFAFGGLRPGTLSMYLFSAAVGLKTIAVPVALLVGVLRLRKALSKGAEHLIPRLPAGIRFLVAPAVATVIFVLSWAGSHYQVASGVGLLPQTIFPAVIGLYTFAVTSYGANLQASLASFFKIRDKFPRLMRLIAAIGIPLAISLVITYQDRVSQEVLKEQFVVLLALGTSYLALTPRIGGLSSGVGRDTGAGPKPITARGGAMRSVGLWLGAGWLLYLFQKLFLADIVLAHDCSGPGDCLQTAGYNATLGVGGGIMGVGATGIANSLGAGGVEPSMKLGDRWPGRAEADYSGKNPHKVLKGTDEYNRLVENNNPDIVFEISTGGIKYPVDRHMTQKLNDALDILADKVKKEWPDEKLRVTSAWNPNRKDPSNHWEGRGADLTVSDMDQEKYGRLAQLAKESGFDWVWYENKEHVHVSVSGEADTPMLLRKPGDIGKDNVVQELDEATLRRQQEMFAKEDQRWEVIESRAGREAVYSQMEDTGAQVAEDIAAKYLAPYWTETEIGRSVTRFLGKQVVSQITDKARTLDKVVEVTTGSTWTASGERILLNQEQLAEAYDGLAREGFRTLISSGIGRATKVDDLLFKTLSGSLTRREGATVVVNQSADSIAAGVVKGIDWLLGKGE